MEAVLCSKKRTNHYLWVINKVYVQTLRSLYLVKDGIDREQRREVIDRIILLWRIYIILSEGITLGECKGDWSRALQEIPQLNYSLWHMLQPTSRRFLRELDEAPEGNNLQYIYYSILALLCRKQIFHRK